MQASMRLILLLCGLVLTGGLAMAQDEQAFQSLIQQGQHHEKQGYYHRAVEAYRKAQAYSSPSDRKSIDQLIDRLEDLIQQQTLVNQARADEVQRKIASLSNAQMRRRLLADLAALQQRDNAAPVDYQSLSRRVEAAKEIETELAANDHASVSPPPRSPKPTPPPRPLASKQTGPPPKSIIVRMSGNTHDNGTKTKPEKTTRSTGSLKSVDR